MRVPVIIDVYRNACGFGDEVFAWKDGFICGRNMFDAPDFWNRYFS